MLSQERAHLAGYHGHHLVVEDQGDDVVRGMVLVGPEIARLVYEHAELRHLFPKMKMAGKTSPPLGGPGPFGQPRICFIYSRLIEICLPTV